MHWWLGGGFGEQGLELELQEEEVLLELLGQEGGLMKQGLGLVLRFWGARREFELWGWEPGL